MFILIFTPNSIFGFNYTLQKNTNSSTTPSPASNSIDLEWEKSWGGNKEDWGYGIATDSEDNIYIVGKTGDPSDNDIIIAKYNSSGNLKWNITWIGSKNDEAHGVAVDSSNNIYIVGKTSSIGAGYDDILLLKYSNSGQYQWAKTWGGSSTDAGKGIAIDSNDDIYVVGITHSFGAGNSDMVLVKYDNTGKKKWEETYGGSENDEAYGVTVDSAKNIYVVGKTDSFGAGNMDMVLVKYDSLGYKKWEETYGGSNNEYGYNAIVDSEDNIYVVVTSDITVIGETDIILVKYDNLGVQKWNKTWSGEHMDNGNGIAIDSSDNVYIVGETSSYGPQPSSNVIILKYDSSGDYKWYELWGGTDNDYGYDIAIDSSNETCVVGATKSSGTEGTNIIILKFGVSANGGGLLGNDENFLTVIIILLAIIIPIMLAGIYAVVKVRSSKRRKAKSGIDSISVKEPESESNLPDILLGMAKTTGEIDLKYLSKQLKKDVEKLRLFVYDLIGSNSIDGKMLGDKFVLSDASDIDNTIDTLLQTYKDWEKKDKGKI